MKTIKYLGIICLCTAANTLVKAEQVRLFNTPPSATEMGQILFGQNSTASTPRVKLRSISFKPNQTESVIEKHEAITQQSSVGLPIEFGYNSTDILPDSIPFLEEVGKMLTMSDYADKSLIIEGHTDAKGSDTYNMALSIRRARAVGDYLVKTYNVSRKRLITRGLGESKPVEGRDPYDEVNRRVQFYSAN